MSLPGWQGTVVPLPSGWRNCLWLPFWRDSLNPILTRIAITSAGLSTARDPMLRPRPRSACQQIQPPVPAHHLPRAAPRPLSDYGSTHPRFLLGNERRAFPECSRQRAPYLDTSRLRRYMFSNYASFFLHVYPDKNRFAAIKCMITSEMSRSKEFLTLLNFCLDQ